MRERLVLSAQLVTFSDQFVTWPQYFAREQNGITMKSKAIRQMAISVISLMVIGAFIACGGESAPQEPTSAPSGESMATEAAPAADPTSEPADGPATESTAAPEPTAALEPTVEATPQTTGTAAPEPGATQRDTEPATQEPAPQEPAPQEPAPQEGPTAALEPPATPFPETSAETDREALVALYNATDGPNWTNNTGWLTEAPIGEWHGVVVNQDGRVRELQLARNQLRGEIPQEIGNLSELIILFLALNELEGPIPSEIGGLQNLELLGLQQNNLSGEIPITLANLEKLTSLNLGANPIVGERPLWLESLVFLQSLSLPKDMTGCVSDFLAEAIRLVWVEEHSIPLCDVTDHPGERTVLAALYHATNGKTGNGTISGSVMNRWGTGSVSPLTATAEWSDLFSMTTTCKARYRRN